MNKGVKIGLGILGIALLVKIISQKGGFGGFTIGNKDTKLQNIYKTFNELGMKPKVSGVLDSADFIQYDFNTPFGVQNTKFYADGSIIVTKVKSGETIKGKWFENGEIIMDGIGSINEGSLSISSLALNSILI
jgi:hypothetical protein